MLIVWKLSCVYEKSRVFTIKIVHRLRRLDMKVRNPLLTSVSALGRTVKQCVLNIALLETNNYVFSLNPALPRGRE